MGFFLEVFNLCWSLLLSFRLPPCESAGEATWEEHCCCFGGGVICQDPDGPDSVCLGLIHCLSEFPSGLAWTELCNEQSRQNINGIMLKHLVWNYMTVSSNQMTGSYLKWILVLKLGCTDENFVFNFILTLQLYPLIKYY